jgi:hypothetical protein
MSLPTARDQHTSFSPSSPHDVFRRQIRLGTGWTSHWEWPWIMLERLCSAHSMADARLLLNR